MCPNFILVSQLHFSLHSTESESPHSFVKPGKLSGREGEAQVSLTESAAVNFMYKSIQNYSGLET